MSRFGFACLFAVLASCMMLASPNPVPLVSQPLVPTSVAPGSGAFTLTVNGVGFVPGALVYWKGSVRGTTFISGHQLQAQIPAADVASATTGSITVRNPIPGGGVSNVVYFQVQKPILGFGFKNGTELEANSNSHPIVGDFNGDGKLDIVAFGGPESDLIQVFPGNGDGTFGAPIITSRKGWQLISMVAGDFNGDGKLDLVVYEQSTRGYDKNIATLIGEGHGKFTHLANAPKDIKRFFPWLAIDKNGDGKLDLYTTGGIYLNSGDGILQFPSFFHRSTYAAFGDFDGDGKLDQATLEYRAPYVDVSTSSGSQHRYAIPSGSTVMAVDLNGDGNLDLVTNTLAVLLGNGNSTFQPATSGLSGVGGSLYFGDFNGDGKLDAVLGSSVYLGNGDGTFQAPLTFAEPLTAIADFNRDGKLDVITIDPQTGNLAVHLQSRVYLSPPELSFANQQIQTTSSPQTVTVTNFGTSTPLTVTQVSITGTNAAAFGETDNCASPLPPNGTCQIQVTFTPSVIGGDEALVNVTSQGVGTNTLYLFGSAVDNRNFTVTLLPSSLKFSKNIIGTTSPFQIATLTNTGSEPITISSIAATAPFNETNNCLSTLAVATNCQIQVAFTPTKLGVVSGTLSVVDNALTNPQMVTLSGSGISAVSFSPGNLAFGNQKVGTASVPIPITLTNNGSNTVTVTQVAITGTNAADFAQTNNCGSVASKGQCAITVTFTPTATGSRSAKVSVSDDGGGSPQKVPLTGTGT